MKKALSLAFPRYLREDTNNNVGVLCSFFGALLGHYIEFLHFFPCPRGFTQEFEAGLHGGVAGETTDFDVFPQFFPAIIGN